MTWRRGGAVVREHAVDADPIIPALCWARVAAAGACRAVNPWLARMEPRLRPVLERHHGNLVALCRSLEQAGHAPEVIRSCIRDLLASYETELAQSLLQEEPLS